MAWPTTKITTFANGTVVTPAFLNSVQDGINQGFLGTYSYKALRIDGTGGAGVAPAAGTLQTSGGITIDSGGLTVTAGGVTVSAGGANITGGVTVATSNLSVTSGDVLAAAGYVKAKRFRCSGTAYDGSEFSASAGWGATAVVGGYGSSSTDTLMKFYVVAQGGSYGPNPTVTITFKDGTFTSAPQCEAFYRGSDDAAEPTNIHVLGDATATAATVTFYHTPVAGKTYYFSVLVIGRP